MNTGNDAAPAQACTPPLPVDTPAEAAYATFCAVTDYLAPHDIAAVYRWHRLSPNERDAWREGAAAAIVWDKATNYARDPVGDLIADLEACEGAIRGRAVDIDERQRLELHGAIARVAIALIESFGIER